MIDTSQIAARHKEFEELAIPHMDLIYKVAWQMTGDATEAQDLTQDVYLRAYRFFDQFEKGTNCKAWLFKILKNTNRNRFKKASKAPAMVDLFVAEESCLKSGKTPENYIFDRLLNDDISKAMDALPEQYREAVVLCDVEGHSYDEITEILDCPLGTVMSRLHRGRKLLKKSLYKYAEQNGYLKSAEA